MTWNQYLQINMCFKNKYFVMFEDNNALFALIRKGLDRLVYLYKKLFPIGHENTGKY